MNFNNRAFKYGDCIFETIKIIDKKVMLLDYHYNRLIYSMKFLKYDIPKYFSKDYFNNILLNKLNTHKSNNKNFRARFSIFRNSEGFYTPKRNDIDYFIELIEIDNIDYFKNIDNYTIDIYRDLKIQKSPLSNLKTNNRIINVMAGLELKNSSILHNLILINDNNDIVEAINGNIFLIKGNEIYTPKLENGCINGVMRKFIISNIFVKEVSINYKYLETFDEIFITNSQSIIPIIKYKNNTFSSKKAKLIFSKNISPTLCLN